MDYLGESCHFTYFICFCGKILVCVSKTSCIQNLFLQYCCLNFMFCVSHYFFKILTFNPLSIMFIMKCLISSSSGLLTSGNVLISVSENSRSIVIYFSILWFGDHFRLTYQPNLTYFSPMLHSIWKPVI